MINFKEKKFWEMVPRGTQVVLRKDKETLSLFFDEIREYNEYGVYMLYISLQKDLANLGSRMISVPVLVDDIEDVISIGGKTLKEFWKENKKSIQSDNQNENDEHVKKQDEPKKSVKTENNTEINHTEIEVKKEPEPKPKSSSPRKKKQYDFEIVEKDGKFFCPCGSAFGRRDSAIYTHRTRHMKKQ